MIDVSNNLLAQHLIHRSLCMKPCMFESLYLKVLKYFASKYLIVSV